MALREVEVFLDRRLRGNDSFRELTEAVPGVTAFGEAGGLTTVYVTCDARTRLEALAAARAAVETFLGPGTVTKVAGRGDAMQDRQVYLWVVGTRRQLHRWESALAHTVRDGLEGRKSSGALIWSIQIEKHLTLIAANNVLRAVNDADDRYTTMPPELAADIQNQRDLHEHWDEQMPFFFNPANPGPLKRGGAIFAARHPGKGPFGFISWTGETGPALGPGIQASALHGYLDGVEGEVLVAAPQLARFAEPPLPSPWLGESFGDYRWWPRADASPGTEEQRREPPADDPA